MSESENQEHEQPKQTQEEDAASGINSPFGDGKTVLIVEDEPSTLEIMRKLLVERGFEVLQADNGKVAWGKFQSDYNKPHIIISDFLMPEMDGFQFFKTLKDDEVTKNIPVVFISARKNMGDSLLAAGADAFLAKPLNTELFLQTIQKISLRQPIKENKPPEDTAEETPPEDSNS